MGKINVGKVRPIMRGDYSPTTACTYYDCYRYNGSWWLHIGKEPTTGVTPEEGAVWTLFGAKGDPFTYEDFTAEQLESLRGEKGDSFKISGRYDTLEALQTAVPLPGIGDAYNVGTSVPYHIYIWDGTEWVDNGVLQGPQGDQGPAGASVTGAEINDNAELIITTNG